MSAANTSPTPDDLSRNPDIIRKYSPTGLAYWSLTTRDFVRDADGAPIKVGEKVVRCPHCGAVKKVRQ